MDHLQIPLETNDASWRHRCNERIKRLKNAQISSTSHLIKVSEEQLSFEKKFMICELSTSVQNKNVDNFVHKLEEISAKRKLSLLDMMDQVTHTNDSLLHVAANFGAEEIGELITCHFPKLLMKRNIKGDTPLHIAARAKNPYVIKMILSQYSKVKKVDSRKGKRVNSLEDEDYELTRLKNEHGNTALHEAVSTNHFDVVFPIFEADKSVAHHLNKSGKSALYLAVVNSNKMIINLLLESLFMDQPLPKCHGISPLHAAISERNLDLLVDILEKNTDLIYLRDEQGGTLLHYAVSINYSKSIPILLERCSLLALEYNTKGQLPIHLACKLGHVEVIKELLKQGENVRGFLNKKGQNVLHVAAKNGKDMVVRYLLKYARLEELTINEKDRNGNTALHLAAKQFYPNVLFYLIQDERIGVNLKNNDDFTAFDLVALHCTVPITIRERLVHQILVCAGSKFSDKASSIHNPCHHQASPKVDWIKSGVKIVILIAILIATVTFAAGITVPGGVYSSDDPNLKRRGTAVLANKSSFQYFTLFNTIAMYGSTFGCTILLRAMVVDHQMASKLSILESSLVYAALYAMYEAFMYATQLLLGYNSWILYFTGFFADMLYLLIPIFFILTILLPNTSLRSPRLWYFMLNWIYIPFFGRYDEKITKKS